MNLDQLTIEIRPRRAWEAVDLGLLMARRWWWPMMQVWLLLTLPLLVLVLLIPETQVWLSFALLWWLKPLFERPLLHILSQAVFDQVPDARAAVKAFWKLLWKQTVMSLTWRRLSPTRSMDLPVIQLEGLNGTARSERLKILHREDSNPSSWLSLLSLAIEVFLAGGIAVLLFLLIPDEVNWHQEQVFTSDGMGWWVLLVCYYLAQVMVAPFYVACGFSLYLNRRIKLEAWDIDIAFQRIVNKRRSPGSNNPALAILLVLTLGIAGLGQAPEATADEVELAPASATASTELQVPYDRTSAKASIEDIVKGEELNPKTLRRYPSFFDNDEDTQKEDKEPTDASSLEELLRKLFGSGEWLSSIATGLEMLFWAVVLCLIALLIFRYRHWLTRYLSQGSRHQRVRSKPVTLFGLDLTRESLPDDVSTSALALWHNHEKRAALALLYRASLSRLLEAGLEIEQGHTEQECLQVAQRFAQTQPRATTAITYFAQLTGAWQRLAYGHIPPADEIAEQLCKAWNNIWQLDGPPPQEVRSE